MTAPGGCELTSSACVLRPDPAKAAGMFALNLRTLRRDEAIKAVRGEDELDALAAALAARAAADGGPPIAWEMHQVVVRRAS